MIQDTGYWIFLSLSVFMYWLLPPNWRAPAVSAVSLGFICFYDLASGAWISLMSFIVYLLLPGIAKRGRIAIGSLCFAVVATAGPLLFYKISGNYGVSLPDGSILHLAVPLGMSYYVFRLIHVTIDAYRNERHDPGKLQFITYVFLFTIFVAGPIQRYNRDFQEGLSAEFDSKFVLEGSMRIIKGLLKQTIVIGIVLDLRDDLMSSEITGDSASALEGLPIGDLWLVLVSAYITSYLNLGAYTDIAIGSSRMFGFRIMENFNVPIAALSITDFWRRWHISLSSWCQDYIYSPVLGWSRNPYIALIASFQVMGLWHVLSANRIAWGLYQAAGVIGYSLMKRRSKIKRGMNESFVGKLPGWFATQMFIVVGFLFVILENSNDLNYTLILLTRILTFGLL